jgi:Tfp pilus assembly protein PilN
MMRRINLLPESYVRRRIERRNLGLVFVAGAAVIVLLLLWWFMLGNQISSKEDELAQRQETNRQLEGQIAELQRFGQLAEEVASKEASLAQVMQGDVDWPALMTEIAMVIPSEVWLRQMTVSAAGTEGESQVPTETAPVRVSTKQVFGRIQFQGSSLTMPGVAKWLLRLMTVDEFSAIYLNNATEVQAQEGGTPYFDFDSTLELSRRALSRRFEPEAGR